MQEQSLEDWKKIDELFGLRLIANSPDLTEKVGEKLAEREKARIEKDWATADKIRDELKKLGVSVRDTENGVVWEYLDFAFQELPRQSNNY